MKAATFAIPGDINTVTGGYIYERRLLEGLRGLGRDVAHLQLAASFPNPSTKDMTDAISALCQLDADGTLILDGLVYGAIDTQGLAKVRAPIVAMIHHPLALETGLDDAQRAHFFKTERDNLSLAAHVLVPSPHTADILMRDYDVPPDKIKIARPGTDHQLRARTPTDVPLILSVGILHPRKGHDTLLNALAALKTLDWRAVIVGSAHDPDYAEGLASMILDLELTDRVELAGRLSSADLDQLYSEASIFALATRYEGYGMVFDEALSWGLPIISCNTGAVPQTVPQDAGILVPIDTPAELADAISQVLGDSMLCSEMSKCAARAGQNLPSWQDTARIAGDVLNAT